MAREVTLIDAGLGNLGSVIRAFGQVGAAVIRTSDPEAVASARIAVFPGQGAFGDTTDRVVDGPMGEALRALIARGAPFLGICLGMQLLFDGSDEAGGRRGLGLLPGRCKPFPTGMLEPPLEGAPADGPRHHLKVPQMGWNEVRPAGDHYYFVHSYYVDAADPKDVMWTADYGEITFPATVHRDNVLGCQFHPEKSQRAGLKFLRAFVLGGWT